MKTRFDTYADEKSTLWTIDRKTKKLLNTYVLEVKLESILKYLWSTDSKGNYTDNLKRKQK